ncbi:FKBP-type peptidyl-prolyl cis-trans isomerase [Chryseobacterium chendengshani]|uniref:FKBP-type peptidyl-prolyl cis-trans isomerase n=1 Tax=Chryseobacterium sp. LJ668 TaxID=2864040 RepID=UPI001C68ADE2|nr:FKBP-type peptidyl-prolyl cis-trans isomerase [Chryseobacterium sp. LJ668]MBW8524589.1 FKBP-type peptidyl-prolyl cis-trans isomerase [Chryseobacterium sp. LJ668]QYK17312.1 FKBP-type peptidyl-prolyl cis-trans isomerase [Chryseobacterium sp. LJ668]
MKKQTIALFCIAIFSISCAQKSDTQVDSKYTDDQKASYYIGLSIAQNMKQEGFKVDADLLARAIKEEMDGTKKLMPAEEMTAFMQDFMQKQNEKKQSAAVLQAGENKKKGLEFLAKNKTNPKVKTTASGLQYEVLQEGDGKTKPKATDVVQVKYTGKLMDGTVFDSTDKNGGAPMDINLSSVIKGWTEGIQLMSKGSKYRFYIPSDLGYGDHGAGGAIPPGATIIFDVELVNIK